MTYVSCKSLSWDGAAATFVAGGEKVLDVEVVNEVEDEDLFDEMLLVEAEDFVDAIDEEAFLFDNDDVDFDFAAGKGVDWASAANLFGTLVLACVGTNKK